MFIVDPYRPSITYNDVTVKLTRSQMQVFLFLYNNRGKKVSKAAIMDHLYQLSPNDEPEMKIIDVFICHIRKRIKPTGIEIKTIWGFGYELLMPRTEVASFIGAVLE